MLSNTITARDNILIEKRAGRERLTRMGKDTEKKRKGKVGVENPVEKAGPISKLLFSWMWPLFSRGKSKTLQKEDLDAVPAAEEAKRNADSLELNYQPESSGRHGESIEMEPLTSRSVRGSISDALRKTYMKPYLGHCFYILITDCIFRVLQPVFLLWFIRSYFEDEWSSLTYQLTFGLALALSTLLITLINSVSVFSLSRVALRVRVSLCSLIQRKMMRLNPHNTGTNEGELSTLLSKDTVGIEGCLVVLPYLLIGPLQLGVSLVFLFWEFGWHSFSGIGFILLYIPFQHWNMSLSKQYRESISKETDERVRLLNELIAGMNAIKMYAWEFIFENNVSLKRRLEVKQIKKRAMLHACQMSIFLTSSRLVPFLTFATFVLAGGPLTADKVFYAMAAYNTLTHYMVFLVPGAVRAWGEIKGSLTRIQDFLDRPEKQTSPNYKWSQDSQSLPSIRTQNAAAPLSPEFSLRDLNLYLFGDKLVMIVGTVGSGKTSLLQLLLGNIPLRSGGVDINGRISYAPQVPWLFNRSLRDNVIFPEDYDEGKYRWALKASALESDVKLLPDGDETLVGESGSGLSGGQRARASFARALYSSALSNVCLFDDPLSAVDATVSKWLFKTIRIGLQGKLRLLVTNQHQYLPQADYIVVMDKGAIKAQGTYEKLSKSHPEDVGHVSEGDVDSLVTKTESGSLPSSPTPLSNNKTQEGGNLSDVENSRGATVTWSTYWRYWTAGGAPLLLTFYILVFMVSQIFITLIELWIAFWSNAEDVNLSSAKIAEESVVALANMTAGESYEVPQNNGTISLVETILEQPGLFLRVFELPELTRGDYLLIYGVLMCFVLLSNLLKGLGFFGFCMRICNNIHKAMLHSLVRAKPAFFTANDVGSILNCFSHDVNVLDELIPFKFFDMATIFLQIGTVVFLLVWANWLTSFLVVFFLVSLWYVRRFYVSTSRELKRIEAEQKGPVLTHLTSSFKGLGTIHALGAQSLLSETFDNAQDASTASSFAFLGAKKSFDMWVEFIAVILLTFVIAGFLVARNFFDVTFLGGDVGLAVCSAMSLTNWLNYGMVVSAEVENSMVSVERSLNYTNLPPEEGEGAGAKVELKKSWPSKGAISFRGVSFRYTAKGQETLKDLNFDIRPGEKVGIVGRTGAGKSSILSALYRMALVTSGQIGIDEVKDLATISLNSLRSRLSIIPQAPVLFKNTLRFNLDPSGSVSDSELSQALSLVDFRHRDLDNVLEDNGSNLSVGEKQLVSLVRTLVRNTKIVAMDEATANIDPKTEEDIQKVIKKQFQNATLITIAHRLETIISYDRIMVVHEGTVIEFDTPWRLLQDKNGSLRQMVDKVGETSPVDRENLLTQAKAVHEKRSHGENN